MVALVARRTSLKKKPDQNSSDGSTTLTNDSGMSNKFEIYYSHSKNGRIMLKIEHNQFFCPVTPKTAPLKMEQLHLIGVILEKIQKFGVMLFYR